MEIYFTDFKEDVQKEILELADIEDYTEMNWDVIPITVIDFEGV